MEGRSRLKSIPAEKAVIPVLPHDHRKCFFFFAVCISSSLLKQSGCLILKYIFLTRSLLYSGGQSLSEASWRHYNDSPSSVARADASARAQRARLHLLVSPLRAPRRLSNDDTATAWRVL